MFLPSNVDAHKEEEEIRKAAFKSIEAWSMELIPAEIRREAYVSVQEVQCGDPMCSPIDTAVTITFARGANGMFGLPMEARDVTMEELEGNFPTRNVLEKWYHGEEAEWPPLEDEDEGDRRPALRFDVGELVQCRIGPDAEKDWAPGSVVQLWYREASWPPGSFAPYKIRLDDGREIFAPGDLDQVVRKRN